MKNETFADRLYTLREKHLNKKGKPMSKRDFADFLGVPFTTYDKWENGGLAKSDSLIEISKKCTVSVDYLLGLSEEPNPNADIQAICKCTGLSGKVVEEISTDKRYSLFINHIFEYSKDDNLLLALIRCGFAYQNNSDSYIYILPDGQIFNLKHQTDSGFPAFEISAYDIVFRKQIERVKEILDKIMPAYVKKFDNGIDYTTIRDVLISSEKGLSDYLIAIAKAFGIKTALNFERNILSDFVDDESFDEQTQQALKKKLEIAEKRLQMIEGENNG